MEHLPRRQRVRKRRFLLFWKTMLTAFLILERHLPEKRGEACKCVAPNN